MSRTWDASGGDYLQTSGSPAALIFGSAAYSMAAWIRPASVASDMTVVSKYTGTHGPILRITGGKVGHFFINASVSGKEAIGATTVPTSQWSLVGGAWGAGAGLHRVTFNGVQDGTSPTSSSHHTTEAANWRIGERPSNTNPFNGQIAMVGLWNKYLTNEEWAALYTAASFTDVAAANCAGAWIVSGSVNPEVDVSANDNTMGVTGTLTYSAEEPAVLTPPPAVAVIQSAIL